MIDLGEHSETKQFIEFFNWLQYSVVTLILYEPHESRHIV